MIVAIDPGLRGCGVAEFDDLGLVRASYVKNDSTALGPEAWRRMAECVQVMLWRKGEFKFDTLVLEVPQVYRSSPIDNNDLIQVAGVDGAICSALAAEKIVWFLPRTWKGQTPKKIHNERVLARLADFENDCINWPISSLKHNVIDAIGLGLYHLGRLPR